jgi:ubiquinone/menaquinone biosynthesis C-methylase UbiE
MNVASDHLVAHAFDAIAADYDRRYTNNPTMRLMRRRVWKTLHARIAEGCRILELGCGTGEDAVFLAKSGCEVVATDCYRSITRRDSMESSLISVV